MPPLKQAETPWLHCSEEQKMGLLGSKLGRLLGSKLGRQRKGWPRKIPEMVLPCCSGFVLALLEPLDSSPWKHFSRQRPCRSYRSRPCLLEWRDRHSVLSANPTPSIACTVCRLEHRRGSLCPFDTIGRCPLFCPENEEIAIAGLGKWRQS